MKVQAESFHLNGRIIGFRLQTQKLDSPQKTPSNTLAVKGLTKYNEYYAHKDKQSFLSKFVFYGVLQFKVFVEENTGKC